MTFLDSLYSTAFRALETDFCSLTSDEQEALRSKLRAVLKSDINDPKVFAQRLVEALGAPCLDWCGLEGSP